MLKTTRRHIKYWENRKDIDWKTAYLDTWSHPHRTLILDYLKKIAFGSLLEVGCASGPNLYAIQKVFPQVKLGGIDVSAEAIDCARKHLRQDTILEVRSVENIFLSDKSVDAVLSDMTLIYLGPRRIHKAISEIKRVCRNDLILVEFHSNSFIKRLGLRMGTGYNAYNYKNLLEAYDFYNIEIHKIPERLWPGGEPQKTFGYIITAKI